jgi:hypothetical protein
VVPTREDEARLVAFVLLFQPIGAGLGIYEGISNLRIGGSHEHWPVEHCRTLFPHDGVGDRKPDERFVIGSSPVMPALRTVHSAV